MQTSTTSTAIPVTNPTKRAMSIARREWDRANDAGEGFAGSDEIDALVCEHLGNGSDALLLVVQDGHALACAYSYGASWCADVTDALLDA